jgi:secreted trypsin-like serine protease
MLPRWLHSLQMPLQMLVAVAVVTVLGGCAAETAESAPGQDGENTGTTQQAITNGTDDSKDPAVVALLLGGKVFCTGALVTANIIVTAAHCVSPTPPDQVFFGSRPGTNTGTVIAVTDSHAHPDFDEDTLENDIALVILESKAPATPLSILTADFDDTYKGRPVRIVGFGATTGGTDESNLHKRSGETAIDSYGDDDFRFKPGPSQTCNGDSGGPALATFGDHEVVVGITSSGDSDCKVYGRDMRIDRYVPFIHSYAQKYSTAAAAADDSGNKGCSVASGMPARTSSSSAAFFLVLVAAGIVAARRRAGRATR